MQKLITPKALFDALPADHSIDQFISDSRAAISNILTDKDSRLLVVVGPCSIHDTQAAIDYAHLLKKFSLTCENKLLIVMRTYFEKPRSTFGWKGFLRDPFVSGDNQINSGLKLTRQLLLELAQLKVVTATEFLDPMTAHYFKELISWNAVGARTVTSQIHRELVSSLPIPTGFKNSIDGNIKVAIEGMIAAAHPQFCLSLDDFNQPISYETNGNHLTHLILRGSENSENYFSPTFLDSLTQLKEANFNPKLMIDCSHGNSKKNYLDQPKVINQILAYLKSHRKNIMGVMLESNLKSGNQTQPIEYGKSITDSCLSWNETEPLLKALADAID